MNSTPRFYSAALWLRLSTFTLAVYLLVGTNNWFHPNKETISIQKTATTELSVLQKMKPIEVKATNPAALGDTGDLKNSNWFATIQNEMSKSEYFIKEDALSGTLGSPNRRNNLRFTYDANGFSVKPRTTKILLEELKPGQHPDSIQYKTLEDWSIRFDLNNSQWGEGYWKIDDNKAEYVTDKVTVQYDNQEEGMRQNFVVKSPLDKGKKLAIGFKLSTTLKVNANKAALEFSLNGEQVMQYKDLKVWDANGKTLAASIQLKEEDSYFIEVDDKDAVYPITIDPISKTASTLVESNNGPTNGRVYGAQMGYSVLGAGDINNDGYYDVIVTAPQYDNGNTNIGAVFVYHGSSNGISTIAVLKLQSNSLNVYKLGDVNGDGYSDIMLMEVHGNSTQYNLYYGSSIGVNVNYTIVHINNQALSFTQIVGDFNNDGYNDFIFSKSKGIDVYLGSNSGISNSPTTVLDFSTEDFFSSSDFFYGHYLYSSAGDVNGDGFDDLLIEKNLGTSSPSSFVIYYGNINGISKVSYKINSSHNILNDTEPIAIDVNGDGYGDLIMPFRDSIYNKGIFIYYGSRDGIKDTANNFIFLGNSSTSGDTYGYTNAGDLNNDGYGDIMIVIGGYLKNIDNIHSDNDNALVIYYGNSNGVNSESKKDTLVEESLFLTQSQNGFGGLAYGFSRSAAGDVNGDGYDDIIVGAPAYTNGERDEGAFFIYHGNATNASPNTNNTSSAPSSTPTLCINTALTSITHTTTGATGIGSATGLPTGVNAAWANNAITISGTPTVAGTFNYSIPLTGGSGNVNATGTITVTSANTVSAPSSMPTLYINTALTPITHNTTGATGIGTATGLPTGITAAWASNTITISGTPTTAGTFNYSIPLTGGCGSVNATGTIIVSPANTVNGPSCDTYTTFTPTVGLGSIYIKGVYAVGSTVYAATEDGGLSISTDGGANFTNKGTLNGLGSNYVNGVYAIGSTVYAATQGGLSISTDGGAIFTNKTTLNGLGSNYVNGVYAVGNTVYAATYGGLSISRDGGNIFSNKTTSNGLGDNTVNGVYAIGSSVYAATQGGLSISTDGGANFTNKTTSNGLGSNTVNGVYAIGSTVYAATRGGLSISTDGGANFTNKTTYNGLGSNDVRGGVYAVGSTVYAATYNGLSISTNGGATFTNKTPSDGLGDNYVNSVYAVGSTVYAATYSGLSISTNVGANFTNKTPSNVLGSIYIKGVYVIGSMEYAATDGGLSISSDGGANFTNKTTANGLGDNIVNGVYAVGSMVYAATNGGLSISTDGGANFTNKTTANGLGSNYVNGVYAIGSTVYAATQGGLSISSDGGNIFSNKTTSNGLGDNNVRGVYAVGSTVYAATFGGGLSISTDGGATFTNKTTSNGLGSNYVLSVYAVGSTVYAATFGGLSISTDGGANFTNKTTANGLDDMSVYGVYAVGSTVYAATGRGLGISTDGGSNFTNKTTSNGLGSNFVFGVYAVGNKIYAATGRGLSYCSAGSSSNTWTGTTSNLWNVATNWSLGTVPTSTETFTITTGNPQLNVDFTVGGNMTISGTGTLTVNTGKTLSVAAGGTADFGGKSVTFKSDATGTAQLGQVLGTLSNASNVTMERYIPARRAFRFIAAPATTTTSIKQNWMENGTYIAGLGTHITGTGGATNGFDVTNTNNASLYSFSNTIQNWVASTNTNASLAAGNAYRLFVRGDRGTDLTNNAATPSATVLRTTGSPYVGAKTYTLSSTAGDWNMIGNPYQSTVDGDLMKANFNNVTPYYYAWDPKMGTRGAYVVYDFIGGFNSFSGSQINQYFQPGQAIFVQTDVAGAASISVNETMKASASNQTNVFQASVAYPMLNATLNYSDSLAKNAPAMDGFKLLFDNSFSNSVDRNDAQKLTNQDENIAINQAGTLLSIEKRQMYNAATEVQISTSNYVRQHYTVQLSWSNPVDNGFQAKLVDNYTNTSTPISFSGNTNYAFTVDNSIAASKASDRFKIVFLPNAALPVSGIELGGTATDKQVKLNFKAINEREMSNYTIERSADGISFKNIGTQQPSNAVQASTSYSFVDNQPIVGNNYYRIKGSSINGQIQYSNVAVVKYGVNIASVTVVPNPVQGKTVNLKLSQLAKGNYNISVTDAIGRSILKKEMLLDGSSSVQFNLPTSVKAGNYFVKVEGQGNSFIQNFIIQ